MKITVVCDAFGSDYNRTAVATNSLIRSMRRRGHEVVVVCPDEAKAGREGYVFISRRGTGKFGSEKETLENVIWDSDAVHIMTASALGIAAVRLCRQHLIPVSADFCAQADDSAAAHIGAANDVMYRRLYASLYRFADAVRYPTELSREVFEKSVGHTTNAYIIPNGVDGSFRPNGARKPPELRNKFIILYCAAYSRGNGHSVLIDAVGLSKYSSKIQLILSGSGPLKNGLKKQGDKLKNKPILADYPYSQLSNLYNYADLYVDPAHVDLDAASCMEALACGLVSLIADSLRNAAKSLAPDAYYLFESRNAKALANKIDRIIEYPDVLEVNRKKSRRIVGEFSHDACMDRVEKMLYAIR